MTTSKVGRKVWSWFFPKRPPKSELENRIKHLKRYTSYERSTGSKPTEDMDLSSLRVTWVIPDFVPGAGGHMTIFRIASYLERFGHRVDFLVQNPTVHRSGEEARATINTHFQPFSGTVRLFSDQTPDVEGDALIATDRFTCYPVRAMERFVRRFYFVQDFEPAFYPAGPEALLTEATYHFDFDCLCAGDWLHNKMSQHYGRWSVSWPLAYDKAIYNLPPSSPARSPARIALYARYVTPRRAVEMAFMALEILHKRGVDFEVDFFGWDLGRLSAPFRYRDRGVLNGNELADLYREATIGVVFSATNHSLVNKEMMACGLPVIDLDLETVRSIFPADVMKFATPTPEGIADSMEELLRSPEQRDELTSRGLDYVKDLSWERSARIVEAAIKERVTFAASQEEN